MTRLGSPRRRSDGNSRRALVLAPRTSAKPIGRISNRFIQKRHANERIIHPLSGSPTKSAEAGMAPFFPGPITFPSFRRARNSVKFPKNIPDGRTSHDGFGLSSGIGPATNRPCLPTAAALSDRRLRETGTGPLPLRSEDSHPQAFRLETREMAERRRNGCTL